jgi:hypothetical protein
MASFVTGRSLTACRPSRNASSFRPSPASISPRTQKSTSVIRLGADRFLLLCARGGKSRSRGRVVSFHLSNQTLRISSAKLNKPVSDSKGILSKPRQRGFRCNRVALQHGEPKAFIHDPICRCRVGRKSFFHCSTRCAGIGPFRYVNQSTKYLVMNVVWIDGKDAIQSIPRLFILVQTNVSNCRRVEDGDIARIQLHCALEVAHGVRPTALSSIDSSS